MSSCTVEQHGSVAVLTFGSPPVNSLGLATRRDLAAAINAVIDDSSITAIIQARRRVK